MMFKRVGKYLTFTVKDIMALEEVSKWVCEVVDKPYFIEVETFPSTQIYHVRIKSEESEDETIVNCLKKFSESAKFDFIVEGGVIR